MKVLILAGGYGTRFARDLESHKDEYPHLVGVSKPLLPVAGQPLISHWMDTLQSCDLTKDYEVYVVVNASSHKQFQKWSAAYPQVKLVSDGSTYNEGKVGAVGCINVAVRHLNVQDHLIVIGGDTLFLEDFKLTEFVKEFLTSRASSEGGALVPCYKCKDDETHKYGILEMDASGLVTSFREKPSPESTSSRMACPCFYMLSKGSLEVLAQFLTEKKDAPLKERDDTGNFIKYLSSRRMVYTKEVSGRFDVGGLQSYLDCCEQYKPSKS